MYPSLRWQRDRPPPPPGGAGRVHSPARRARAHGAFDVEALDLRDWPLPMFAEHLGSIGDFNNPTYSAPVVREWNRKVGEGAAYLVVTPEYNHSVPGVLKNAIDSVFVSFALRHKPLAAVGYSGGIGGGVRAIEHLAHIAIEADMVPLRDSVVIPFVRDAFDTGGRPKHRLTDAALQIVLDDLSWWSDALGAARAAGELPPGQFRMRAAMAETDSPDS